MTEAEYDEVVTNFYRAASGSQLWGVALEKVRCVLKAQVVNLYAADKQTGAVIFSFETGDAPPESALDFIRTYNQMDPRAALAMASPVGQVVSCHRHFDEAFVAQDRFYQEFLIPYGGRYSSGMKVHEDAAHAVIWSVHRPLGAQPVSEVEENWIERLGLQLRNAVSIYLAQQRTAQSASVGLALLQRMSQPMLLLDDTRWIVFCNDAARGLLEKGHVLRQQRGFLCGPHTQDDAQLLIALRSLGLSSRSYLGNAPSTEQVFMPMRNGTDQRMGVYLYAMRPRDTMGAFGHNSLALVMLHDPGSAGKIDALMVAATWNLTPAEAKVAISLTQGRSSLEIAQAHGVSHNTVRTQIQHAMEKMGVKRQAELVRQVSALPPALS